MPAFGQPVFYINNVSQSNSNVKLDTSLNNMLNNSNNNQQNENKTLNLIDIKQAKGNILINQELLNKYANIKEIFVNEKKL